MSYLQVTMQFSVYYIEAMKYQNNDVLDILWINLY